MELDLEIVDHGDGATFDKVVEEIVFPAFNVYFDQINFFNIIFFEKSGGLDQLDIFLAIPCEYGGAIGTVRNGRTFCLFCQPIRKNMNLWIP